MPVARWKVRHGVDEFRGMSRPLLRDLSSETQERLQGAASGDIAAGPFF